jgi:phosphatidylglycerol:prolipoprotein diacylglycerol transferase
VQSIEISIDPLAFALGPFKVHWYGMMVALAVAALVVWVWYFTTRRGGATTDQVMAAALWMIPLGLIFSRLVHVIDRFGYYTDNPGEIFGFEGLTIFGAILGGLLGAWIYCRLRRVQFGPLADLTAPGVILVQAIGRVGCVINGCCCGKETSLPWGFFWTHPDNHATACASLGTSVHPTQMYELLGDLVIFALLFWVFRGRLRPKGSLLALYLLLYSALTFTVRFWRGDVDTFAGPIQEGQLIAMIVFVLAAAWLVVKRTHWVSREIDEGPGEPEAPAAVGAE